MTEHVHEFEINYEQTGWEIGHIVVECMWCPKTLKIREAEDRLNENETLKADKRLLLHVVHGRAMASSLPKHLKEE